MGRDSVSLREHDYGVRIAVFALLMFVSCSNVGAADSTRTPSSNELTLREYVDVRFDAQEKAVSAALAAAKEAVTKAEAASEKRFEAVNEFRGTLSDQSRTLMPRAEAENQFKVLSDKMSALEARVAAKENQSQGLAAGWGYLVAAFGIITGVAIVWLGAFKRRPSGR